MLQKIISGGQTGADQAALDVAKQHHRPRLHVGLNKTIEFEAAQLIHSWIVRPGIRVLNVEKKCGYVIQIVPDFR